MSCLLLRRRRRIKQRVIEVLLELLREAADHRFRVGGQSSVRYQAELDMTGDFGMGVSIYSYAGTVQFGLITDAALTPDPEAVVSRFPEEFEKYLYYALLDKPGVEKTD